MEEIRQRDMDVAERLTAIESATRTSRYIIGTFIMFMISTMIGLIKYIQSNTDNKIEKNSKSIVANRKEIRDVEHQIGDHYIHVDKQIENIKK